MLGLVFKLGCVPDGLYLALYLYDTGRYQTALAITDRVKQKLSQPHIMYNGNVDRQRYSEAVGGQSMLTKYRKAWVRDVVFDEQFTYIEELRLEQEVSNSMGLPILLLSPFVTVHMLSVLCHYRLGNRTQYLQALTDLHTLLLYDDGRYVPLHHRDLAWQILGICQHVVGDLLGALQSYQESLRHAQEHKIQTATEYRISLVSVQNS
jgi:tetratricopeptide (TPR) repeat protein